MEIGGRSTRAGLRAAWRVARATAALGAAVLWLAVTAAAGAPDAGGAPRARADATGADPSLRQVALEPASAITFHASDAFGGFDGKAPVAAFSMELDPERPASAQGSVDVKSDAVTTGNFLRDVNAARTVFESSRYPTIRYTLSSVHADPASLRDGGGADLTVRGRLRMHGIEREVAAHGEVSRHGDRLEATLSMPVRLSDFGMTRPRFLTVVVEDTVQVHVHLLLRVEATPSG